MYIRFSCFLYFLVASVELGRLGAGGSITVANREWITASKYKHCLKINRQSNKLEKNLCCERVDGRNFCPNLEVSTSRPGTHNPTLSREHATHTHTHMLLSSLLVPLSQSLCCGAIHAVHCGRPADHLDGLLCACVRACVAVIKRTKCLFPLRRRQDCLYETSNCVVYSLNL